MTIAIADFLELLLEPAVVIADSGRIAAANTPFCKLVGLTLAEAERLPFPQLCASPEGVLGFLQPGPGAIQPMPGAVDLRTKDGHLRLWCFAARAYGRSSDLVLLRFQEKQSAAQPLVPFNEQIAELQHEIAERRRAEQSLRELAAIVESSEDAILSKNLDGSITSWNEAAERMFGYSAAEILGKPTSILIPPERVAAEAAVLERVTRGERMAHYETVRMRKDGVILDVSLTVSPVKDETGRIVGSSKIVRDITAQKQLERALAEAREQLSHHAEQLEKRVEQRTALLQETVRSLDRFCYTIAHDLRAPLRAMVGFSAELLEHYGEALGEGGRDFALRIKQSALRMDHLILDLLEYGRLNTIEIPLGTVHLEPILTDALSQLQPEIATLGAQVKIRTPLSPVRGNPMVFRQVLSNLLGNALKFIPPGSRPEVEVWTEEREETTRVFVKDNGIGIKREYGNKLFQPFVRLVRQDEYPGTGIGLAIVRKAVERMGGCAGFESELGRGSVFWVEVPKARVNGVSHEAPALAA